MRVVLLHKGPTLLPAVIISKLYYRKHLSKNVTIHYFCLYLFLSALKSKQPA